MKEYLGQGGGDAAVADKAACLVGKQGLAVGSGTLKLGFLNAVSHSLLWCVSGLMCCLLESLFVVVVTEGVDIVGDEGLQVGGASPT